MRFGLLVLTAILVSTLSIVGLAAAPTASALSSLRPETAPLEYPFQPYYSYLSVALTTDKAVYLSGETINITMTTNAYNTHVRLTAQLPDGSQSQIGSFTFNYSHTVSWTAPATEGQIRLNGDADALTEVWDYCSRWICIGPGDTDCHWDNYPCLRTVTVTGNAYNTISVFSRNASIGGRVVDANQNPIPGATVTISSTGQTTTTGSDGSFQFNLQLGNSYGLTNGVPTVADTISVDAIACEPQPGKTVQIQAGQSISNVGFTLNRIFYPADLDPSYFTYDTLAGWTAARDFTTWQNITGITVESPTQIAEIQFGNQPVAPMSFSIGDKLVYFVTAPQFGRYLLDIQGAPDSQYMMSAAATVNGSYLRQVTLDGVLRSNGSERVRLMLEPDQIQLQPGRPFPIALTIVLIVIGVFGGLVTAFFLTGGKARWQKALSIRMPWKTKLVTNISKPTNEKAVIKSAVKDPVRRTAAGKKVGIKTKLKK